MEVVRILRVLWHRKWWVLAASIVAVAVAVPVSYDVSLNPPHLRAKQSAYALASTVILVDRQTSTLADASGDLYTMSSRASAYAQFMSSGPVLQAAATAAGLSPRQITTAGPFNGVGGGQIPAEKRANQLIGESSPYRMLFEAPDPNSQVPIITIYAQAPTPQLAERLANGAANGLAAYVTSQGAVERVAPSDQVVIRQLTPAKGEVVASGAGKSATAILAVVVWVVLCLLIIVVPQLVQRWREMAREERLAPSAGPPGTNAPSEPAVTI